MTTIHETYTKRMNEDIYMVVLGTNTTPPGLRAVTLSFFLLRRWLLFKWVRRVSNGRERGSLRIACVIGILV